MKRAVFRARSEWKALGTELGIHVDDLNSIEHDGKDSEECLTNMLTAWLCKRSLKPSWKSLADALQAETVGREDLADDIIEKYLRKP